MVVGISLDIHFTSKTQTDRSSLFITGVNKCLMPRNNSRCSFSAKNEE